MQKIGFNQRYGLQQAVLDGTKTITRRLEKTLDNAVKYYRNSYTDRPAFNIISQRYSERGGIEIQLERDFIFLPTRYKLNEIVAVAQSYETLANGGHLDKMLETSSTFKKEYCGGGWGNKMFVKPSLMPHQIKMTDIRIERLQDISDEDCFREGIVKTHGGYGVKFGEDYNVFDYNPRDAFATLIDKVSGKGTWERNPYMFVYKFELIK